MVEIGHSIKGRLQTKGQGLISRSRFTTTKHCDQLTLYSSDCRYFLYVAYIYNF